MSHEPGRPFDLVTGATGMLGSHIAEKLVARGRSVRALVRPGSDTRFLKTLGVTLVEGNLTDPDSCRRAVRGCRGRLPLRGEGGRLGPLERVPDGCIDATRNLAEAAIGAGVRRFLHISSTSAYGHPVEGGPPIDEIGADGSKHLVLGRLHAEQGRVGEDRLGPGGVEGPSGDGDPPELALRRARPDHDRAGSSAGSGTARSCSSAGAITRSAPCMSGSSPTRRSSRPATRLGRRGVQHHEPGADHPARISEPPGRGRRRPPVTRKVPYRVAYAFASALEAKGRLLRQARPPWVTRYATWLMGRELEYSTEKARTRLGWAPALSYRESIERTVAWLAEHERGERPGDRADGLTARIPPTSPFGRIRNHDPNPSGRVLPPGEARQGWMSPAAHDAPVRQRRRPIFPGQL